MTYSYKLEKYKGLHCRYACPRCGHKHKFTRYVSVETGAYLADHVGRCERIESCRYHYPPAYYFRDQRALQPAVRPVFTPAVPQGFSAQRQETKVVPAVPPIVTVPPVAEPVEQRTSYIPEDIYRRSHTRYAENNFVQYLYTLGHDRAIVNRKILQYRLGTSARWPGATVFWQVDREQRVRTGKIMLYDRTTGRRVREPYSHIAWAHTTLELEDFHLRQCLYGEHLLHWMETAPVAIVESEKSAVIASLYRPDVIWMAAGGKELLNAAKLEPLRGRQVTLYPDAGAYDLWADKAKEYRHILPLRVSDMVERHGEKGMDIADVLVRLSATSPK